MNKSILIIDDEQKIRNLIKMQLQKDYPSIYMAGSRKEALLQLRENDIQVIICDIKLKDINGFDLIKEIKTLYPGLPIIVLTGFIDNESLNQAKELECFEFITKPAKKIKLLQVINNALEKT